MENKTLTLVLNGEYTKQEICNLYNLSYCQICGNFQDYDELQTTLSGNYKCEYCESPVMPEDMIIPRKK